MAPIVLLDTNVFIASRFGDTSRRIVAAWEAGRFTLGLSTPILREYEHILGTVPFLRDGKWESWQAQFKDPAKTRWVEPTEVINLSEDPADNKFLEAASALKTEAIVSSDHHLLDVAKAFHIPIMKPGDFASRFPALVGKTSRPSRLRESG